MKKMTLRKVKNVVLDNIIEYFTGNISAKDFIEKHIKTFVNISTDAEKAITAIMEKYSRLWYIAPSGPDGGSGRNDKYHLYLIEQCASEMQMASCVVISELRQPNL